MTLPSPSFRTRILMVVVIVAVIPLGLMGLWLTRSAARSGEALLHSRLEQYLNAVASRIGANWIRERSDLLFLAEDTTVQRTLGGVTPLAATEPPASLQTLFAGLPPSVTRARVQDTTAATLWTLDRNTDGVAPAASAGSVLVVDLPIYRRFPAGRLGTLEVHMRMGALLGDVGVEPTVAGLVLAAFDRQRGVPLLPLPFDPARLAEPRFTWAGEEWLTAARVMTEPGLRLVAAAPVSRFAGPFEAEARRATWWLAVVALSGVLTAAVLTRRLTRRLERLASAAGDVSGGHLDVQVEDTGSDEVGHVARAFNTMTGNLRRTLDELASRERLAAVGEFAASLAHEVRNPLTAIRLDLQRVEEALPADSMLREPQTRALREIERLDATVGEALDVARGEREPMAIVSLADPLDAAADAAEPAFATRQATLERSDPERTRVIEVRGDGSQLEQLFLNLLLNAATALGPGGRAWIDVETNDQEVIVHVCDAGTGIPEDMLPRVFEPLYSTRTEGTGLGLTVARRIAEAHRGRIEITSEVGRGTAVHVYLRLADGSGGRARP